MGLDMFLYGIENATKKFIDRKGNEITKRQIIKTEEIYWRKANQIHGWFVENVQYHNDDCGYYPVTKDELKELKSCCKDVLKNKNMAKQLLPTYSGCFFGSYEYDEYYFEQIKFTKNQIEEILEKDYDYFEYVSSW